MNDGYLLDLLGGEFTLLGLGIEVPKATKVDGISVAGLALNDMSIGDLLGERYLGEAFERRVSHSPGPACRCKVAGTRPGWSSNVRPERRRKGGRMTLNLEPNLSDPDGFYEALLKAHEGLSDKESRELNARLVLVLANQIGDPATLAAAIEEAK